MLSGSLDQESISKTAAAEYIAIEMSRLARVASANQFGLLAYLIDMAVLEAWREANEEREQSGREIGMLDRPEQMEP